MPINAKILVVAPDPAFRRSLAFVLETEGCRVDVAEHLTDLDGLSRRYDCLVVDHRSLPKMTDSGTALAGAQIPVIALASHSQDMVARGFARVLEKPLLGQTLIEAVCEALKREPRRAMPT